MSLLSLDGYGSLPDLLIDIPGDVNSFQHYDAGDHKRCAPDDAPTQQICRVSVKDPCSLQCLGGNRDDRWACQQQAADHDTAHIENNGEPSCGCLPASPAEQEDVEGDLEGP